MLFNSPIFIFVYLPFTLALFFWIARYSTRLAAYCLFVMSLVFYAWWNPVHVPLLVGSICLNYAAGRVLAGELKAGVRKFALVVSICANLAVLVWFKYALFLLQAMDFSEMLFMKPETRELPLGISFFTFTQITFLVDAYRGEAREYRFGQYGLFVTYFPHLIAGPILHHREMMPQFQDERIYRPSVENLSVGSTLFIIGLFKKVIIADGIAPYAVSFYKLAASPAELGVIEAWLGVMAFSFQIYFDFSGYSDMALGLARMFGIRMPINFYSPYKARSMVELWRRWNMTLSRLLRDYVFVPLGGNKRSALRRYSSLLLTMLIGGVWHGAGWTFVVWGILLGAMLAINHAWLAKWRRAKKSPPGFVIGAIACAATYSCFAVATVFFKADTLDQALRISWALWGFGAATFVGNVTLAEVAWIVACSLIIWGLPNSLQIMYRYSPGIETFPGIIQPSRFTLLEWRPNAGWATIIGVMGLASLMMMNRIREFLYFAF